MTNWIILAGEEGGPKSNKLGGIWNVIEDELTALASLVAAGKINNTRLIVAGPYYPYKGADWHGGQKRVTNMSDLKPLKDKTILAILDRLRAKGIDPHAGVRDIDGVEVVYVLFNAEVYGRNKSSYNGSEMRMTDMVKTEAYELVALESMHFDGMHYGREFTHYLNLSHSISCLVEELAEKDTVSLHCHEFGVFYAAARLERLGVPVRTVATFHATIIGRSWGAEAINKIIHHDQTWNPGAPTGLAMLEMLAKYAGAVTFVGSTTLMEARLFYGINGVVIRNGIAVTEKKVDWEKKARCRKKIQEFLADNIHRFYDGAQLDPEKIIPIFTISRMEIENKGYPDLLDALVLLDRTMKDFVKFGEDSMKDIKIVCFFITAAGPKDPKMLPEGFPIYLPDEILIGDELRLQNMISAHALQPKHIVSGHVDSQSPRLPRSVGVLLYPQWLSHDDGGLDMTVDEIAAGCVLAVFPSKYEPFLLTGLEACREATPCIVSRACGFSDAVHIYETTHGKRLEGVITIDNIRLTPVEIMTDYSLAIERIIKKYIRELDKYDLLSLEAFLLAHGMGWEEPAMEYYDLLTGG